MSILQVSKEESTICLLGATCEWPNSPSKFMDTGIKPQATQQSLLVRQEGLLPHLLRRRSVHRVMNLMSRLPPPPPPWHGRLHDISWPETTTPHRIFCHWTCFPIILPQRIAARSSSFWGASEEQEVFETPFSVASARERDRREEGGEVVRFRVWHFAGGFWRIVVVENNVGDSERR